MIILASIPRDVILTVKCVNGHQILTGLTHLDVNWVTPGVLGPVEQPLTGGRVVELDSARFFRIWAIKVRMACSTTQHKHGMEQHALTDMTRVALPNGETCKG